MRQGLKRASSTFPVVPKSFNGNMPGEQAPHIEDPHLAVTMPASSLLRPQYVADAGGDDAYADGGGPSAEKMKRRLRAVTSARGKCRSLAINWLVGSRAGSPVGGNALIDAWNPAMPRERLAVLSDDQRRISCVNADGLIISTELDQPRITFGLHASHAGF
jgi:hypothetical protein